MTLKPRQKTEYATGRKGRRHLDENTRWLQAPGTYSEAEPFSNSDASRNLAQVDENPSEPKPQAITDESGLVQSYTCGEGYYYHNWRRTCRPCKSGCLQCKSRRKCTECMNDDMTVQSNGKCLCPMGELQDDGTCPGACPSGQYYHTWRKKCRNCGWKCAECSKWWKCEKCEDGFTSMNGACQCLSGRYGPGFTCLPENDSAECGEGEYSSNGWCYKCQGNCKNCKDDSGECTECEDGRELSNKGTCECADGSYDYYGTCHLCEGN